MRKVGFLVWLGFFGVCVWFFLVGGVGGFCGFCLFIWFWVFFLQQSSVLEKHISGFNPAAPQELVPVLPPAAPWFGCVSLTRGSSILEGASLWEELS